MFIPLKCESAIIANTARIVSFTFTANRSINPRPDHGFWIQCGPQMSICSPASTNAEDLHLVYRLLTSTWSSEEPWATDYCSLWEKHGPGPWRSFKEVSSSKWTILHLKYPIQCQGNPMDGQLVLGLSPGNFQALHNYWHQWAMNCSFINCNLLSHP